MYNLEELFTGFFADKEISLAELSIYAHVHIDRMIAINPEAVFAARITATQVALAALEERTSDTGVKAAIQKGKTLNKKNFRDTLPGHMGKIHGKVIGQYGKKAAEVLEIFPKGLSIFERCR